MDEATANVDYEMDAKIQGMIRTCPCFRDVTIITIAHRVQTILDSDQVIVLDDGVVSETGTPDELLSNAGIFKSLVEASHANTSKEI